MSGTEVLTAPSLARRMACWLYEGMLLFGVLFSAGLVFSIAGQMRNAMDPRHELLQGFLFIVCGVYCVWCWSKGQTLAMRTWRIRVVDRHGRSVTQGRAMLRYLYCWIWAAVLALHLGRPPARGRTAAALIRHPTRRECAHVRP